MPKPKIKKDTKKKSQTKKKYRVRNWGQYNESLKQRGSIDVWIDEKEVLEKWYVDPKAPKKKGAQAIYSDTAIITTLQLGKVFSQRLRQTERLTESIFMLKGIDLGIPDYSTLSRRAGGVTIPVTKRQLKPGEKITVVVDGSGVKIYGEGEWKVRKHGYSKRRTWRKIHLMSTPDGEIRAAEFTENTVGDNEVVPDLLSQEDEETDIEGFAGDGAFDTKEIYELLQERGIEKFLIPPQTNAKIWSHGNSKTPPHPRDVNLRAIRKTSRKAWKETSGYHVRSLSETAFFRFKTIFGEKLHARKFVNQKTEFLISVNILNAMTRLGMPESYVVA